MEQLDQFFLALHVKWFLMHFSAQNLQSEHCDCAKEVAFQWIGPKWGQFSEKKKIKKKNYLNSIFINADTQITGRHT